MGAKEAKELFQDMKHFNHLAEGYASLLGIVASPRAYELDRGGFSSDQAMLRKDASNVARCMKEVLGRHGKQVCTSKQNKSSR